MNSTLANEHDKNINCKEMVNVKKNVDFASQKSVNKSLRVLLTECK